MHDLIIIFGLILISSIFNTEMDKLKFKPSYSAFPYSQWWTYNNPSDNWFIRAPLSMIADGWHFCKFIMKISQFSAIAYPIYGFSWYSVLLVVVLYIFQGIEHEIMYNIKLRSE